jgi:hypothetical protein
MRIFSCFKPLFGNQFYPADISFVANRLSLPLPISLEIPKQTLARHRQIISHFFGFRRLLKEDKEQLASEITELVKQFHRPSEVFRQIVKKLQVHKFILPSYDFLSTIISRELYRRKLVLSQIIKESLSEEQKQLLDSLLEKEAIISATESETIETNFRAKLTLLKNPSQSLKATDIKANLNDWSVLQSIYDQVSDVITKLDLSSEALRYYANAVLKSELFQISRQKDEA